jgi:uncharacterized membrane protein YhaH (DUF805 family)
MKKLLTTKGRASRSLFWGFSIFTWVSFVVLGAVATHINLPHWAESILGLVVLLYLLVGIIVQIKRWHDLNKSGVWVLINFILVFGPLWTLIQCGFFRGTEGENQYGLDPLDNSQQTFS